MNNKNELITFIFVHLNLNQQVSSTKMVIGVHIIVVKAEHFFENDEETIII